MSKSYLYRAFSEFPVTRSWEGYTIFIEAFSRNEAITKITTVLASISSCPAEEVSLYNLMSWQDLIEVGQSKDLNHRIFETDWKLERKITWIKNPLFLAPENNDFLLTQWQNLQRPVSKDHSKIIVALKKIQQELNGR